MTKITLKRMLTVLSVLAFWGLGVTAALAGPIVLKCGWTTSDSPTDPYALTANLFKKNLGKVAPGQFDVQLFPNRQLGDEKEMVEGLTFGTMNAAVITNAVIAQIEPAFQINDMPFLYPNKQVALKVLDGPVGNTLLQKLQGKKILGLGFADSGFRQMINNVRPIYSPDDVKGIKWRVMQNPVFVLMFECLGGNAIPMAWGEVFTAVQQGTIDGLEIPIPVIYGNGYNEVCKYLSLTQHTYTTLGLLMSQKFFDKLTPAQQAAVKEAARITIAEQRVTNAANIEKQLASLGEKGMKINKIKGMAEFRAKVKPVYDKFRSSIGSELMDMALQESK
ncbi:MAG: TRAP transporter substrate-binding protein [Deltaproteobacteria bacterium]|nr:TRAP transporter substrate-binding protein [Deltaproteobacteria bacterium]